MTKDDLIDKYRDINVDDDYWYEYIKDDLNGDLEEQGFWLDQMYFSGCWSQGDGACFTGRMVDWKAFCAKVPQFVADFPNTAIFLQDEGGSYTITHSGRYYHQYSTTHEYDADNYGSSIETEVDQLALRVAALPEDSIEATMRLAIYKAALLEDGVETWLKEYFRGLMADLYKTLGEAYDYFTSDEVVWETIEANELDKELDEEDEDDAELVGTMADIAAREVVSSVHDVQILAMAYGSQLYRRAAYICEGGEVKRVHDEGYTTVASTFISRPKGCQYSVLTDTAGKVLLVDMFDLHTQGRHTTLTHKEESTPTFPTVEAAIMYAVTTY